MTISEGDLKLLLKALGFAAYKHKNQRRRDVEASPYINHPITLANILCNEAHVTDSKVICAALLHDTLEDTDTTAAELEREFGAAICGIVMDVTDDKTLRKAERKQLQIEHAARISEQAKLVKLADKISNLRDMDSCPPEGWDLQRRREYFDWARAVIDRLRGVHGTLETIFDAAYARRP
ncbi:MAG: HD domain-containing protein [Thiohalobacterales bacterium]|nr:HD domain-containing protein [Thiohalobacterales bacterium]